MLGRHSSIFLRVQGSWQEVPCQGPRSNGIDQGADRNRGYGKLNKFSFSTVPQIGTAFLSCIQAFSASTSDALRHQVQESARGAVAKMKERFLANFSTDRQGMPRTWGPLVDLGSIARDSKIAAAEALSSLALMRLSAPLDAGGQGGDTPEEPKADLVARSLYILADPSATSTSSIAGIGAGKDIVNVSEARDWPAETLHAEYGPVADSSWVILRPDACRRIWAQFSVDVTAIISQAQSAQQASNGRPKNLSSRSRTSSFILFPLYAVWQAASIASQQRALPMWVVVLIVILGWNEFMSVLRSPFKLVAFSLLGLFLWTLYRELDVDRELQRGLPGLISLSTKLTPAIQKVSANVVDSVISAIATQQSTQQQQHHEEVADKKKN